MRIGIDLGGGLSNIERLYRNVLERWGDYVFSDRVDTRLLPSKHGDSNGVRGAAWLWQPPVRLQLRIGVHASAWRWMAG